MQAQQTLFSEQIGSDVTWARFPTLETLYDEMAGGSSEESRRTYFDAIVRAGHDAGCKVLAIELSILDRSASLDDKMTFRSCFYQLDHAAVGSVAGRNPGAAASPLAMPPYDSAMQYMMKFRPEGAAVPEPIVLHPGLRNHELLYIVSDPRRTGCVPVPETTRYKLVALDATVPTLLRDAQSDVTDQVVTFHRKFLDEIERFSSYFQSNSRQVSPGAVFEHASLLVVPFIRDTFDRAAREEVAGEADRDIVEREGASGLVAFIWLVPHEWSPERDFVKTVANRVLELHRVLLVKDNIRKSSQLAQKSQFVQDAAHGIANQIAMLQLKAVTDLFYEGRRPGEPRISTYRMVDGRPEPGDQNIEIIEQYDESVDFISNLVSNYLAVIELGTGPGYIRQKFQADVAYDLETSFNEALEAANRWRPNDFPLASFQVERFVGPFKANRRAAETDRFMLPAGYLRSGILQSQLIETILNSRKHGSVAADGTVKVLIQVRFDPDQNRPLSLTIENSARARLLRSSPKASPLNFVPGLEVGSNVIMAGDTDSYSASYAFGSVFCESRQTGIKFKATPYIVRSGDGQDG